MIIYVVHRDVPYEFGEVYCIADSFDDAFVKACNMIMISSVFGGRVEESELSIEAWQSSSSCSIRSGFIASIALTDICDSRLLSDFLRKIDRA